MPKLAHASLISIRVLCKQGCKVLFDDDKCRVYYKGKLRMIGKKYLVTDLWLLPLQTKTDRKLNIEGLQLEKTNQISQPSINNMFSIKSKQKRLNTCTSACVAQDNQH